MNKNMDNLFVRAGRPLRLHIDDSRITAAAIRQLSWRVEQGGGAIVGQPSAADVLVVDPAAPWVFHDFLKTKRPELRPSVVLAFWIPLCLTTRSLIWINHPYWQQVVIPPERPSHSDIPQGITAYSSFLAGISYSKNTLSSTTKALPRSSTALRRDGSVISNLDNSDLEVSRSLEPGTSSDDEPLEIPRKPKEYLSRKTTPRADSPSSQHPAEVQKDDDEVSGILPTGEKETLTLGDIDMSPPSLPNPVQQPQKEPIVENVAPLSLSAPAGPVEKLSPAVPDPSGPQRYSPHQLPHQEEKVPSPSHDDPSPASATVTVEPAILSASNATQATTEAGPVAAPQHAVAKSASPVASEAITTTKEAYVPPTLDSSPPPVQEEPNSTPLDSSPKIPNVITHEPLIGATAISDELGAPPLPSPSVSNTPSTAKNETTTVSEPSDAPNRPQTTQGQAATRKPTESTGSTLAPGETVLPSGQDNSRASTSTAPPITPAAVPKTSTETILEGSQPVIDALKGTHSSRPSPSNATRVKVRPKMRPPPQPKSNLKLQSDTNGVGTNPRPSIVVSKTGEAPLAKPSHSPAPADSLASTISPLVTNHTTSIPVSVNTSPATTVAADTPNPGPGSSLSRPKKMIVRSPTSSLTTLGGLSASVSPVQTRHPAPALISQSHSSSPEVVPLFGPPTPPTPTPEQLTSLAAKRSAWTKEEDQYIIDYMNWVFAQDPLASTSEIMREIASNCPYRGVGNWQNRFTSKEDSIYMNEVPVLFERLTNKTSGAGSSSRRASRTLEILSGSRTRNRSAIDYVDSSDDEKLASSDDGDSPPRKKIRRGRRSNRLA